MADRSQRPGFRFPGPPPKEALDYFRGRDLRPGFSFRDVWLAEHAHAFTVAKAMEMDLLADIRAEIDKALAEGRTLRQFREDLTPILQRKGWWGKKAMTDPLTGKVVRAQLGSPRRLRTIYRSNLRAARAAGQWDRAQRTKQTHPYLLYELGPGKEHRDRHAVWAGTLLPVDDPWWDDHFPPNGWDCRCRVRQVSRAAAERRGGPTPRPPRNARTMTNRRTGMRFEVDEGLDPAWASNPGKIRGKTLMDRLNGAIDAAHPADARAAVLSVRESPILHWFHREAKTFAKHHPEIAKADPVRIKDQAFSDRLGHLPVALFGDKARKLLKPLTGPEVKPTRVVRLSAETAVKQAVHHPELRISHYRNLPELISDNDAYKGRDENHLEFFGQIEERWYQVVVKQTSNNELFLKTFHEVRARELPAALKTPKEGGARWGPQKNPT